MTPTSTPPLNPLLCEQVAAQRRHLQHCRAARGRWFPAALVAERLDGLVGPRFVSTVVVGVLVLAAMSLWA